LEQVDSLQKEVGKGREREDEGKEFREEGLRAELERVGRELEVIKVDPYSRRPNTKHPRP
jgi:hypothetical protein